MNKSAFTAAALPLAARVAAFEARAAAPRARAAAREAIIATVGALMCGSGSESARRLAENAGTRAANGPCLVAGTTRRTAMPDAALANGAAASAGGQETGDGSGEGHATRFAALFALAEARKLSGQRFHAAWLAGEAAAHSFERAAPTVAPGLSAILATVAAASHLLHLDAAATAAALVLGASTTNETDLEAAAHGDALATPLRAGQRARTALQAVMLAEQGETGAAAHLTPDDTLIEALAQAAATFGDIPDATPPAHLSCDAFVARCSGAIGASEALALYERLEAIDEASDIALLGTLMARRALPGAAGASAPLALSTTPGDGSDETAWVP
ncbi:MmgE/PrpD family protein [Paraburkholderia flagellata]|uniref:MmgE/PrpD family protein n=1 Tax=Paraburkholderia flagellata TaxID=2883241 RepID=UPI001F4728EF|nr:MmgE/PrpD family protein [Paraburkholderia flagellata]